MKTKLYQPKEHDKIVRDLRDGFVVSIPTDTVYGLAGRCDSHAVMEDLQKIKGRAMDKPFPIMVSDEHQLEKVVHLSARDKKLVRRWFPGAITFIFNKTDYISDEMVNGNKTVAVRIPNDEDLLKIVTALGEPVFLTSANKSGQENTSNHKEVLAQLDGLIHSIIAGESKGYQASTIIDATGEELKVLREGEITLQEVIESLEE